MAGEQAFDESAIATALAALPGWAHVDGALQRRFQTASFKAALMVVNTVGYLCEAGWHHPEIALSYSGVTVRLWTHTAGGVTAKDVELAVEIDRVVAWTPGGGALTGPPDRHAILRCD